MPQLTTACRASARLLIRLLGVLLCFVLTAAPGCSHRFYWQGPTTGFKSVDTNKDGVISRLEAQFHARSTILHPAAFDTFIREDCDNDGVVTWREYHASRWGRSSSFNGAPCLIPDGYTNLTRNAVPTYSNFGTPLIVSDPAEVAPRSPDTEYSGIIRMEYEAKLASRVANRTEQNTVNGASSAVGLSCSSVTGDSGGVSDFWLVLNRWNAGPIQQCSLVNANEELTLAAIFVRVSAKAGEREAVTLHSKAVVEEAQSDGIYYVLHEPGTTAATVELVGMKFFTQ